MKILLGLEARVRNLVRVFLGTTYKMSNLRNLEKKLLLIFLMLWFRLTMIFCNSAFHQRFPRRAATSCPSRTVRHLWWDAGRASWEGCRCADSCRRPRGRTRSPLVVEQVLQLKKSVLSKHLDRAALFSESFCSTPSLLWRGVEEGGQLFLHLAAQAFNTVVGSAPSVYNVSTDGRDFVFQILGRLGVGEDVNGGSRDGQPGFQQ